MYTRRTIRILRGHVADKMLKRKWIGAAGSGQRSFLNLSSVKCTEGATCTRVKAHLKVTFPPKTLWECRIQYVCSVCSCSSTVSMCRMYSCDRSKRNLLHVIQHAYLFFKHGTVNTYLEKQHSHCVSFLVWQGHQRPFLKRAFKFLFLDMSSFWTKRLQQYAQLH